MSNPGFDFLKQAFDQALGKYRPEDLADKGQRIAASAGKALVQKTLEEFPKDAIEGFFGDVYGFIGSQDFADGVSLTAQSASPEEIQDMLDQLKEGMAQDEFTRGLAEQLKQITSQGSFADIEAALNEMVSQAPPEQQLQAQLAIQMALPQIRAAYDQLENASPEEIAEQIREAIDAIPTDMIAFQVYSVMQNVTPERVNAVTAKMTSDLPSPTTISGIVHGLGDAALKQLGRAADPDKADAPASVAEFVREAEDILRNAAANDDQQKQTFRKDKGFDFGL